MGNVAGTRASREDFDPRAKSPDPFLQDRRARWRAALTRDSRADGLFFYGVRTTGIYCRPICPARKPKPRNVIFFDTCAAAEAAGFRACKMCRPTLAVRPRESAALAVRSAGILFVDIVGSSDLAWRRRPEEMLALLDDFHTRMGRVVRSHAGVVHKLLGDGFMAVFGVDRARRGDARRAVSCGAALLESLASWNAERAAMGQEPIEVGIGVHYGTVAFGTAGGERTLIGDTVNVASRLQSATRRLGVPLLVSDEAMRAISAPHRAEIERLVRTGRQLRLPGCGTHRVWSAAA